MKMIFKKNATPVGLLPTFKISKRIEDIPGSDVNSRKARITADFQKAK